MNFVLTSRTSNTTESIINNWKERQWVLRYLRLSRTSSWRKALESFSTPIEFWGRYVDDTIVIIKRHLIDDFTAHINWLHPSIKFTMDMEENGKISVLDVLMARDQQGQLRFEVHRKPTHTSQYLNFPSHHPLQHKLGVIWTLIDREDTIATTEEDKQQELNSVRISLAICGYQDWSVVRNTARDKRRNPEARCSSVQR